MRYSLLSRFRGALLGAAIGDLWPITNQSRQQNSATLIHTAEEPSVDLVAEPTAFTNWGAIAITIAQTLVQPDSQSHRWSDWLTHSPPSTAVGNENSPTQGVVDSAGWAIATLPLLLCYHDNFSELRSHLTTIAAPSRADALVLGYTLAHILQNRLNPATLISQILGDLELEQMNWALADQLTEVQKLVRSGASLAIAQRALGVSSSSASPSTSMALALYCFLCTPEDFRLSLLRCTSHDTQPSIPGALLGALSGCMNTTAGLPLSWRNAFQSPGTDRPLLRSRWGVETEPELLHVADHLLAHWAGVYRPTQALPLIRQRWAIAAPNVIRPL